MSKATSIKSSPANKRCAENAALGNAVPKREITPTYALSDKHNVMESCAAQASQLTGEQQLPLRSKICWTSDSPT